MLPVILVESSAADPRWLAGASAANWAIWLLFLADSVVKTRLRGWDYVRSWMGALDLVVLVVSLPGLVAFMESTRLARPLRLGRATRLGSTLKMMRTLRSRRDCSRGCGGRRGRTPCPT